MKFIDLNGQWNEIKDDVYKNLDSFFESSAYVMGPYLENLKVTFLSGLVGSILLEYLMELMD